MNYDAVSYESEFSTSYNLTFNYVGTGNYANAANLECITNFNLTEYNFLKFRSDDYPSLAYMYSSDADNMVEKINKDLGFSSALMEKMNTTTWSQGRQTDSNSKYRVTWTYHPDKGLEVMYEMNSK